MKKILWFLLLMILLVGCGTNTSEIFDNVDDLAGKKVGVASSTYHAQYADNNLTDSEIVYFNTVSECIMGLKTKKIDAFIFDTPTAMLIVEQNEGLASFVIEGTSIDSGFIFSNDKYLADFNEFLAESRENGFLEEMEEKWITNPDSLNVEKVKYENSEDNGEINIIFNDETPPYAYISNDELQGYSVELAEKFASIYGYKIKATNANFDAVLSGVSSGKYDMGVDEINITDERKKVLKFTDPIHECTMSVVYATKENTSEKIYTTLSDLYGQKMGVMSGSIFDLTIRNQFPGSEIIYFNSRAELLLGLKQGKIEGFLADLPVATVNCHDNNDLTIINEYLESTSYGICFSKEASKLRDEFNVFLNEIKEEGYLAKLQEKWFAPDGVEKVIEEVELTGENGTIKSCTTVDAPPFAFYKNNQFQGYEVDLMLEFAKRYGYKLEIEGISFDAIISSVASNKFDAAFNGIFISEERAKRVDFSEPDYESYAVAIVRKNVEENTTFIDDLKSKFYRTFIDEDRYKLIIDGIFTTLLIVATSMFFGTVLGFICFFIGRKFNNTLKKVIDSISYVIQGLPVLVILMILFYIIFAKSSLSGVTISIIGFSLIEGLAVYDMLNVGVGAIDKGQFEGALALGYTNNQTLFKFIFPQAFRIIMPSYRGEIVSLVKSSSIVGYVTVQDLTRVSDIIRSRTYDAFFPLIVTAIIYFFLANMLARYAKHLQKKYLADEKSKDEILKSVGQKK